MSYTGQGQGLRVLHCNAVTRYALHVAPSRVRAYARTYARTHRTRSHARTRARPLHAFIVGSASLRVALA